ncbi:S8 family serine peptidase [Lapillicoccus sp.]|uniref:S8 family serine peptidase n=1 Tax=Lapillicoccus sp. TaxID=1909287 RepID=UPI003982E498
MTAAAVAGLAVGVLVTGTPAANAAGGDTTNPVPVDSSGPAAGSAGPAKASDSGDKLGTHDQELLASAKANKEPRVTLLIAADKGSTDTVATQVKALGGTVAKRVDAVGYIKAVVPTDSVTKAARIPGIAALDLNESVPLDDPRPDGAATPGGRATALAPAPGATTPASNPYLPTNETGSVAFKAQHPEWDGRGTTIGILDSGVDLDNPALQTTSTGQRKIVDWVTATDPVFDGDRTWRPMTTSVTGPAFTISGRPYTGPTGTFMVSRFSESITAASQFGGDVNRDGDKSDTFGVLYDPATKDIRVDSDDDGNFTNNPVMRPYNEKDDVGHFGVDKPETAVREQVPFVVEYRTGVDATAIGLPASTDYVNIGIIEDEHGSHVAGIAAANDMFDNAAYDGQAPGAKIVSSRACTWGGGCTAAALTDGMIDLVVNRRVDVVNMSIGGLPALNDANNARARLYDRLINDFGVQLFISAGNSGSGVNTIGDPSVATDVVSVAASISKETWLANYGSVVQDKLDVMPFSSRGPREDGGFKPNITAPGAAISTIQLWLPGMPVKEAGYDLPPGTAMLQGTSMASPQAAGAAALLLSAARANDLGVTPAQLRQSIYSSAAFEKDIPAHAQGNGFFDVPGAWRLLKDNPETRTFTSSAPVCTPLAGFLATPGRGEGIYNRCASTDGGQKPGQSRTYAVTLTRTSGPVQAIPHKITWVGDKDAFRSDEKVSLPLNRPVTVRVDVKGAAGAHSAIMQVDDPGTRGVDHALLNTVIVSNDLVTPGFGHAAGGTNERNHTQSFFVTVPPGAAALQVNLGGIATGSQTRFIAINPYGLPADPTSTTGCYLNYVNPANTCKPDERSYENPLPGVWEIEVEARRTSPSLNNPFQIRTAVQGVTVSPKTVTLPSVRAGVATPVSWTLKNTFAPVTVSGQGGPLGSAVVQRPTIADKVSQTRTVDVPAGASRFDAAINNPSDPGADLDLFVVKDGVLVGQSADGDSDESVSLKNPVAGTYTVVVDGYAVPSGSTQFDYRDVFYSAALGSLTAPAASLTLANGASATLTGAVTALSSPAAGRQLFGDLTVVTDQGAVVGRGSVLIGAVS